MGHRKRAKYDRLLRMIILTFTCFDLTAQYNSYRNDVSNYPEEFMKHEKLSTLGEKRATLVPFHKQTQQSYNELSSISTNEASLRLRQLLTTQETTCSKLLRVGGRSCRRFYDGAKMLCMDEDVAPPRNGCLTYSFGVGNDFSFDEHMQDFGCEVHAFDHDKGHEDYEHLLGPLLFYHKARIGAISRYIRLCKDKNLVDEACGNAIRYRTMKDLRREMGHEDKPVFYLKMDVEGAEWDVLRQSIDHTRVLHDTKQFSLEVHLDMLKTKNETKKRINILAALDVMTSLRNLGFRQAFYEHNGMNPETVTIENVNLYAFAEILFLKRG